MYTSFAHLAIDVEVQYCPYPGAEGSAEFLRLHDFLVMLEQNALRDFRTAWIVHNRWRLADGSMVEISDDALRRNLFMPQCLCAHDVTIQKPKYNAFSGTNLDLMLAAWGCDTLLLTGTRGDQCVAQTALHALEKGYSVRLLEGCIVGPVPDAVLEQGAQWIKAKECVRLLADAKIAEDNVEQIFHIDAAGQAAKRTRGDAQIFGHQFGLRCG